MKRTLLFFLGIVTMVLLLSHSFRAETQSIHLRTITITVFVDRDYINQLGGQATASELEKIVATASEEFEKEFLLTFRIIRITPWDFPARKNRIDLAKAYPDIIRLASNESADIVFGFTPKAMFRCIPHAPAKKPKKEEKSDCPPDHHYTYHAGVATNEGYTGVSALHHKPFKHELSHIFGAKHSDDPDSIMHDPIAPHATAFDEKNKKIIRENRNRQF